ncbi:MAG: hypothetical protein AB1714_12225 [Acidobacteriota bacterium]
MRKPYIRLGMIGLALTCGLALPQPSRAQAALGVADIVERSRQTAGSEELLASTKTYSFTTQFRRYHIDTSGRMKVVTRGMGPVIMGSVSVTPLQVLQLQLDAVTEVRGVEKMRLQFMARLAGGFFTLSSFRDSLTLEGLRDLGAEKHYVLTADLGSSRASFYVDEKSFLIRRIVLQGTGEGGERAEYEYQFGQPQDVQGLKLPQSIWLSGLGEHGNLAQVSEPTLNPPLEDGFFTRLEINAGLATLDEGTLHGNLLMHVPYGDDSLVLVPNWTPAWIEKAGFKSGETLIFQFAGQETEVSWYASEAEASSANAFRPGAKILSCDSQRGDTCWLLYYSVPPDEIKKVTDAVSPLIPLVLKRKP